MSEEFRLVLQRPSGICAGRFDRVLGMSSRISKTHHQQRSVRGELHRTHRRSVRPDAAYRQRRRADETISHFSAPEIWHEPQQRPSTEYIVQPAGEGYVHPVTVDEIRNRLASLPEALTCEIEVVQLSEVEASLEVD